MSRRALCVLLLCAMALPLPALRADQPPSRYFPKDTFLYVEGDVAGLLGGIPKLDLVRMLDDEQVQDFLAPTMEAMEIESGKVVASLLEKLPLADWVDGRVAIGLRGIKLTFHRADGQSAVYELGPGKPVSAALLHEMLGFSAPMWIGLRPPQDADRSLVVEPDLLIVVDPGTRLREVAPHYLEKAEAYLQSVDKVEIAGRHVTRLVANQPVHRGVTISATAYADMSGDRWFLSSSKELLTHALQGGSPEPLSQAKSFLDVRARLTGGTNVAFAYLDLAGALGMVESLVPPLGMQEMEILGLTSVRGVGMGFSLVAGGVRESLALTFDGQPRGLFKLLEAAPRGLPSLDIAPLSTAGYMAMKFDAQLLLKNLRELAGVLAPGNDAYFDMALERAARHTGIDIAGELLPALGDELAMIVKPTLPIPQVLATLRVRDEEKVHRLLEMGKGFVADMGMRIRPLKVKDGGEENGFKFRVNLPGGMGQNISVVVRHGHLMMSNSSIVLRNFVKGLKAEGTETMAAHSEVFKKVMKGLTGGDSGSLVALGYTNLQSLVEVGLPMLSLAGDELEGFVDTAAVPEMETLRQYISGVAFALRRDAQAVSFDVYSPVGLVIAGAGAAIYEQMERQKRMEEFIRAMEAERAAEANARADKAFVGFRHLDRPDAVLHLTEIISGTPAEKAGLMVNDIIVGFDGQAVANITDFRNAILAKKPGDQVIILVRRGEAEQVAIPVILGRYGDFNK